MSVSNNIISKPVSVSDIKTAMDGSTSSNDVGYLCSNAHGLINPYSKNKPISMRCGNITDASHKISGLTDDDKKKLNWGYRISAGTGVILQNLANFCRNGTRPPEWSEVVGNEVDMGGGWIYSPPKGGSDDPYRMGDWIGYNHNENQLITFEAETDFYVNEENTFTVGGKTLSQFGISTDCYYGLYFCKISGSDKGFVIMSNTRADLADGSVDIVISSELSQQYFTSGESYYVLPILALGSDGTKISSVATLPVAKRIINASTWVAPVVNPFDGVSCTTSVTSISVSGKTLHITTTITVTSGTMPTAYGSYYKSYDVSNSEESLVSDNAGTFSGSDTTILWIVPIADDDGVYLTKPLEIDLSAYIYVGTGSSGTAKVGSPIAANITYYSTSNWQQN